MGASRKLVGGLAIGAAFFSSSLLTACSNTVSKADFKKELDDAGLGGTVDTQCLVDGLETKGFKFRKYDVGGLSADENKMIADVTTDCISKKLGVSIPSTP